MTARVQVQKLEHRQQRVVNVMVRAKCDVFVKACSAKWSQRRLVIDAVERVKALHRHVLHARAKVASSKKFRTQLKFLQESTLVKHFD
jgi:hypothetical protein